MPPRRLAARGAGFLAAVGQIAAAADGRAACGMMAVAGGRADDEKQAAGKSLRAVLRQIGQPRQHAAAEGGQEAGGVGNQFGAAGGTAGFLKLDHRLGGKQAVAAGSQGVDVGAVVFVAADRHLLGKG